MFHRPTLFLRKRNQYDANCIRKLRRSRLRIYKRDFQIALLLAKLFRRRSVVLSQFWLSEVQFERLGLLLPNIMGGVARVDD
jgi:hypothetical protein